MMVNGRRFSGGHIRRETPALINNTIEIETSATSGIQYQPAYSAVPGRNSPTTLLKIRHGTKICTTRRAMTSTAF